MIRTPRLARAADVILRHEFLAAWPTAGYEISGPQALAISGGVDSIALAAMCAHYHPPSYRSHIHAFIVDHNLRPTSTREATEVHSFLVEELDMPTRIIPVSVPLGEGGKNLEALARTARFRALGIACRDVGAGALFLAHHADDQVETIVDRLSKSHVLGLSGIDPIGGIPECFGLHGVAGSGDLLPLHRGACNVRYGNAVRGMETGGVRVVRPLLGFEKARLRATCEFFGVRWWEDATNKDQTLTVRNAVRHIYATSAMPKALSKTSILGLGAVKAFQNAQREREVERLFSMCDIRLDVRSGVATVRIPHLQKVVEGGGEGVKAVGMGLLRRLAELVSPLEQAPLKGFDVPFEYVFGSRDAEKKAFTNAGVAFYREDKWHAANSRPPSTPVSDPETDAWHSAWILTREPAPITDVIEISPSTTPSPFTLWDRRFWISVLNPTSSPLRIRVLDEATLRAIRAAIDADALSVRFSDPSIVRDWAASTGRALPRIDAEGGVVRGGLARTLLERLMGRVARGGVRYSLPVLEGEGGVVGLPTLGVGFEGSGEKEGVRWEVRFKDAGCGRECFVGDEGMDGEKNADVVEKKKRRKVEDPERGGQAKAVPKRRERPSNSRTTGAQ
ncbi:hypothetical protein EJ06DRAFT_556029 [Trichodelitschia bisporula]|uniref:tRNA(Ile)-lysidine synthetase n=1 Tax=Trichodelitschia bisporula TaxID=703511 RepID=A0A6G1HZU9_9PEZI|nr:hypothetical protein EJ06DRAFT_556029 [Trichodelitschia bisporula]